VIPYGKQDINQIDIDAVISVLQSDFLTQGPKVPLFEKTVSSYCGAKYGVAVNSATSALHIACLSLGLKEGDWLWTSPISFVASANCALYCGAKVDFVDIDKLTYNMSVRSLEVKLDIARKENKLPKIIIPVHFSGQSCDMKRIHSLGEEYGFKIIEDASHAIGGKYLNNPIGSCKYSDITIFSFHPVKIITTAEGGLATTNSEKIIEKMHLYRSHGITRNKNLMTINSKCDWYYQQIDLGFNYRMSEMQAALGISQMKRLDEFVDKRHLFKERYDRKLTDNLVIKPYQNKDSYSSLHLYPVQINLEKVSKNREQIYNELREEGVGVNVHYIPIHLQPYYKQFGFKKGDFPKSEFYYSNAITLPLFPSMTIEQQDKVLKSLNKILQ
jgi:UDP-4-amino-4,6-dideoxy-N-acetyl-beta-L-altrosamine transaminase